MTEILTIQSTLSLSGFLPEYPPDVVKNEPMLFNCDLDAAYRQGGQITRDFIAELSSDWLNVPLVIDSRVHMLMPGWYPCIPGWHHDDVPRTRSDGQPNYGHDQCRSRHVVALVNGDICPTEFAIGRAEFSEPELGRVIYSDWHVDVERLCTSGELRRFSCPDRRLVYFDDRTWHRGTAAVAKGWRFFIRASRYYSPSRGVIARGNPRTNEVRRQVQVYLDAVNEGW